MSGEGKVFGLAKEAVGNIAKNRATEKEIREREAKSFELGRQAEKAAQQLWLDRATLMSSIATPLVKGGAKFPVIAYGGLKNRLHFWPFWLEEGRRGVFVAGFAHDPDAKVPDAVTWIADANAHARSLGWRIQSVRDAKKAEPKSGLLWQKCTDAEAQKQAWAESDVHVLVFVAEKLR